jgi:predicted nucleic acid-binding protein
LNHAVFVDTSAWYALADRGDTYHQPAVRIAHSLRASRRLLVTTNHVTSETYTLVRARLGYAPAQDFLSRLRASSYTERRFVPEAWEDAAEVLLAQYRDQDFSYVDATSFITMRRLGLQEVFTFDHHFTVVGFILLVTEQS